MNSREQQAKKMIPALLREREGYKQAGQDDRVKLVDDQLKLWGYKSPNQEARQTPPQGRTERPPVTGQKP